MIPHHWKTNNSSRNMYMLTPEFNALVEKDGDQFVEAVQSWEIETAERRRRLVSAEAVASAIDKGERLVTVTRNVYCLDTYPNTRWSSSMTPTAHESVQNGRRRLTD